jgi:hypothetical protein
MVEHGHGIGRLSMRVTRWEFLVASAAACHAFACGQETPDAGAGGGTNTFADGVSGRGGAAGSGGGNAGATPSGGTTVTGGATSGGDGGSTSNGASVGSSGGSPKGGSGPGGWRFSCGDPNLPEDTGARAGSADFSPNSDTAALEPHVLYLNGYFLIRRVQQYVTDGEADHQHEILLTDEQIDALILGNSVVVETNGPPLNASSGHGHTITIRSCFIV